MECKWLCLWWTQKQHSPHCPCRLCETSGLEVNSLHSVSCITKHAHALLAREPLDISSLSRLYVFKQMRFAISKKHTVIVPSAPLWQNLKRVYHVHSQRRVHDSTCESSLHILFKVSLEADIRFHINTLGYKTICEHEPRCRSLSPPARTSLQCQLSSPR